jgi:hypothetical protein
LQISVNALDPGEVIAFAINGADVNLNTLIINGEATVVVTGNGNVNSGGNLQGDGSQSLSTTLLFSTRIDSIALAHTGGLNGSLIEVIVTEVTF